MPETFGEANAVQRQLRRFAGSGPGSWVFSHVLQRLDEPVIRATRGRHSFSSLVAGLHVIQLTTTGARSGQPRTVPLLAIGVEGGLAVIASNFGGRRGPAWSANLRAHPEVSANVSGRALRVRAVVAEGDRRAAIWRQALTVYPGYATYERRAAHRDIAVWVLEPV